MYLLLGIFIFLFILLISIILSVNFLFIKITAYIIAVASTLHSLTSDNITFAGQEIIDIINLLGRQDLIVSLRGSRNLIENLLGEKDLINLKGEVD